MRLGDIDGELAANRRVGVDRTTADFLVGLAIQAVAVADVAVFARHPDRRRRPFARLQGVRDLLAASTIHEIDYAVADRFGELRARLFDRGITVGEMDLLNAGLFSCPSHRALRTSHFLPASPRPRVSCLCRPTSDLRPPTSDP